MVLLIAMLADVSADAGVYRGAVGVRADGRLAFGPILRAADEGLARLAALQVERRRPGADPLEIQFEKNVNAEVARKVLDRVRGSALDIPTCDWAPDSARLKAPECTLVFAADSPLLQTEIRTRMMAARQGYVEMRGKDQVKAAKYLEAMRALQRMSVDVARRVPATER